LFSSKKEKEKGKKVDVELFSGSKENIS